MMKLEFWRRWPRQLADGEPAVDSGSAALTTLGEATQPAVALAAAQQTVQQSSDKTLEHALEQAAESEHQLLRRAAQQRHDDTVPATFYRTSAD